MKKKEMEKESKPSRNGQVRRGSCSSNATLSSNSSKKLITSARKQSPPLASSTPTSAQSTPKKVPRKKDDEIISDFFSQSAEFDFVICGSPAPRISDRANSLPSARPKRPSVIRPGSNATMIAPPNGHKRISSEEDNISLELLTSTGSDLDEITSPECNSLFDQEFTLLQSTYRKKSIDRTKGLCSGPSRTNSTSRLSGEANKIRSLQSSATTHSSDNSNGSKTSRSNDFQTRSLKDSSISHVTSKDMCSVSPEYTSGQSSIDNFPSRASVYDAETMLASVSNNSAIHSPFSQRSQSIDLSCATFSRISSIEDIQISTEYSNESPTNKEEFGTNSQDFGETNHSFSSCDNPLIPAQTNNSYDEIPTPFDNSLSKNEEKQQDYQTDSALAELSKQLSTARIGLRNEDSLTLTANEMEVILNSANTLTQTISSALARFLRKDEETKEREYFASTDHILEESGKDLKLSPAQEVQSDSGIFFKTTQTDISLQKTEKALKNYEEISRELSQGNGGCSFDDNDIEDNLMAPRFDN